MKKFTRIFFAVAALFAFACTTDTTEDLGVQLGNGAGQTTLTLSLEESRTQLGTAVNGLYPVTWSDGDAISVNGVKSSKIEISENKSVATFTFDEVLSYPYAIAYPATTVGKVVFADVQQQVEGTFTNGAAAMYGYREASGGSALSHLTGVLKIGVTGDKTIVMAQISTIDRAPIAGEFELDFATGELTPTTASKEIISCTWEEEKADGTIGFELGTTPQYLHFAVPAGVYDELYVTLYDADGGVMYATVKANDEKPLVAGNVREFSNSIAYAPNDSVFVIKDVATLKEFAAQAATLEKNAIFVADVDMTGEEWTPIDGYTKTILGNGYAIKGLTAPLFGTTSASIKALHLENVALVTNDAVYYGALACKLTATDEVTPTISHCSVSGTFTVKNPALTLAKAEEIAPTYGALVGLVSGAILDACENKATVTVEQLTVSGNEYAFVLFCGGVVGCLELFTKSDKTVLYSALTNSKNYGTVEYKDNSNPTTHRVELYLGGIAGVSRATNTQVLLQNNENHGEIIFASNSAATFIGGIAGYAKGVANFDGGSDCVNYGKLTVTGDAYHSGRLNIGGVWGGPTDFTANRCHNYGAITFEEGEVIGSTLSLGGVAGKNSGGTTSTLDYCTNNAPILIASDCAKDTAVSIMIGGVVGYTQSTAHNNTNNKEGTITISGNFYTNGSRSTVDVPKSGTHALGGVCGYKTVSTMNGCTNHADIIWSGDVIELSTGEPAQLRIGGIQGYGSMDIDAATFDGTIYLSGTYGCEIDAGGIHGFTYGNPGSLVSDANFEISGTFNGGLILGGVISIGYNDLSTHTYNGTMNITKDAVIKRLCAIGGCIGHAWGINASAKVCKALVNNGTINVGGTIETVGRIGGCLGWSDTAAKTDKVTPVGHNVSDLTNNGPINVSATVTGGNLYIGGCAGPINKYFTGGVNNATLTFSGNHPANNFYFAGVAVDVGEDSKNGTNYGDIICTADCYAKNPRLAGVSGYVSDRVTNGINHGNLTFAGECSTLSIAGICYYGTANNCTNGAEGDDTKGQIIFTGKSTGNTHFGGIMRDSWISNTSGSTNYGDMHISGVSGGSMYIGGCIYSGIAEGYTCTNYNNYGDINVSSTIGGESNTGADFFIGGIAYAVGKGDNAKAKSYVNCHNYGKINVTSECSVANSMRIGGLIANIETAGFDITFDSCSNHGDICIAGTSSAQTGGSYSIGGCISNFDNNKQLVIKGGMKNTGNITLSGENKTSSVIAGGVFGTIAADAYTTAFELYLANEGNITVSAKAGTAIHAGGVVGNLNYAMAIPMYNTGDITVTGVAATPADNRIGGLVSATEKAFHGECFCNIKAVGFDGVTGMLTGSKRADAFAEANSKVGGTICTTQDVTEIEDGNGDIVQQYTDKVVTLDATNYFDYLYGSVTWVEGSNYDGCTLLSSKDEIVYPTPVVEPEEGTTESTTPEA